LLHLLFLQLYYNILQRKEQKRTDYAFWHWFKKHPKGEVCWAFLWYSILHLQSTMRGVDVVLDVARIAGAV